MIDIETVINLHDAIILQTGGLKERLIGAV